jgi:hypothetical protein
MRQKNALAKPTTATTNSTIELILTPRSRAGYAGIKSRVGFRMITSFPENGFIAGLRRRSDGGLRSRAQIREADGFSIRAAHLH